MPAIRDFGRGRNTVKNPTQLEGGEARDSLNLLHNHGPVARLRNPARRCIDTRSSYRTVLGLHEYVKASDGSTKRLGKFDDHLATFGIAGGALTSILSGMDSTHLIQMATANGFVFVVDWAAKNYISDGTSGGTYELQRTISAGGFTLANHGTATGNAAASIKYWVSDVDPATGQESPPSASVTVARTLNSGVRLTNVSLDFTAPWTKKTIYREKAGDPGAVFVVASLVDASNFPYDDTSLDTSLTTLSEIHDGAGAAAIEKPEAAKHVCWHRGRLFIANLYGHPSRLRWSMPLEPTQFSNSTVSRWDVAADDGGEITGLVSFRGALVIFKTNAIHILNGDVDENAFTVFPAVQGIGAVACRSIVQDGELGIYFLARGGVYRFDLSPNPTLLSEAITPDIQALNFAKADYFCAGLDPMQRLYMLSAGRGSDSVNTLTHVFNIATGAWGRFEYAGGYVVPTSYSPSSENGAFHNARSQIRCFFGDSAGYVYESDYDVRDATFPYFLPGDGDAAGLFQNEFLCLADVANFTAQSTTRTRVVSIYAGDGPLGLDISVIRAADGSIETRPITAYTAESYAPMIGPVQLAQFVAHDAWTGTAPIVGVDTIVLGGYAAFLAFGRDDMGSHLRKRWRRADVEFAQYRQYTFSGSAPTLPLPFTLWLGATFDDDALPLVPPAKFGMWSPASLAAVRSSPVPYSYARDWLNMGHRRAVAATFWIYCFGIGHQVEPLHVETIGWPLGSAMSPG